MSGNEPPGGARILLIEDDSSLAALVARGLKQAGFSVELACDGRQGTELVLSRAYDLIILDLMLPELDGFQLLAHWRGRSLPPVLVITARTDLEVRVQVLAAGADDYMPKPFWVDELVARIRARLRRSAAEPARRIEWDDTVVDLDARTVTVQSSQVSLTATELEILCFLLQRPGRAISRVQLAEAALPSADSPRFDRTIDSHIARIRHKLGPSAAARIVTVWGIGYRFDVPPSAAREPAAGKQERR
jgi:two-component system OmpR family response regulator